MSPSFHLPHGNPRFNGQFWLREVGFDAFQQERVAHGFRIDGNGLSGAKSLLGMAENHQHRPLCNTHQLTQPLLRLSVRFCSWRRESGVAQLWPHYAP